MRVSGLERRLFSRKLVAIDVVFEDEFGEGVIVLKADDLSLGGLFIASDIPIKIGSYVFLSFSLPGSKTNIHATGQVMRVVPAGKNPPQQEGIGIRFVGLSRDAVEEITEFVA
jgi:hypothetical protein